MKKLFPISLLTLSLMLSGCALTKARIPLSYVPQANVSKIAGAESIAVTVLVQDQRSIKDSVGKKKNAYGMEMASIIATNDVATLLKGAIETELIDRGFQLTASNSVRVTAELNKFYNDFKTGFFAGDSVAEIIMNIEIRNHDGRIVFSKLVTGQGKEPNIQLASGENARLSLDAALKDVMAQLFSDPSFTDTLLKSKGP